jgi:XTP/dITP diphosphohydrolase
MKRLVIATKNYGKIKEIRTILKNIPFSLLSLQDIGFDKKIEETGKTFEENALLKAKTVGDYSNTITLGEDSGIVVDALNGQPGIYSARYAKGNDEDRNNKILKELSGIVKNKRTARFIAVIALYNPKTHQHKIFEGVSQGYIADSPKGKNGFGYDPIFYNSDLKKTNGEVTLSEKNKVSHRARAFGKFISWYRTNEDWFQQ